MESELKTLDYEAALAELERTVQLLGKEQEDLAESVRVYERGLALAQRCSELLTQAEHRLAELSPATQGKSAP